MTTPIKCICFSILLLCGVTAQAQIIRTVIGNDTCGNTGDYGPATAAEICGPQDVALDTFGNLYVIDIINNCVRKVSPAGIITPFAGTPGSSGFSGDNFPATDAQLWAPYSVCADMAGNVYIGDAGNERIRKVSRATGIITTVAGNGLPGYSGDDSAATAARLKLPYGVTVDRKGNLYIADVQNARIRKVDTSGIITTYGGTGVAGYSGDHGPATNARLSITQLFYITSDDTGNVYFGDSNRIRKIDTSGIITTYAGTGALTYSGDHGPATAAGISCVGLHVDHSGNLFLADMEDGVIRKIDVSGIITTVAGGGADLNGDYGPATAAFLRYPSGVTVDADGNIYIAESGRSKVREVVNFAAVGNVTRDHLAMDIAPNPSNGDVVINLNHMPAAAAALQITDIMGRPLQQLQTATNQPIPLHMDVPPGVYFITVTTAQGRETQKIIVQ